MAHIDFDADITLEEAAAISGLTVATIRGYAHRGRIRTRKVGKRTSVTTRRWLHDYLVGRASSGPGQPPKPLPEGYEAPPPRKRGPSGPLKAP